ncbi:MAG: serine hydrolase [Saprospiraceae bacterium]|nr:serine hydrolase [Saprospiraceae bacterium]
MQKLLLLSLSFFVTIALSAQKTASIYYPGPGDAWEHRTPEQMGMNPAKIQEAIDFAIAQESTTPKNLEVAHYQSFGREPFGMGVGPFKERGAAAGIIVYKGYIVAEWGDVDRVDMTFSVTKSFLSTTVGLAVDKGLIKSVNDKVYPYMAPVVTLEPTSGDFRASKIGEPQTMDLFATDHNKKISWDHLLRQTSNWEGTLWGKPDWADRPDRDVTKWNPRELKEPGSEYEYNDVRVNVLALAALNVWRKPLPQVLKENIMDPIGASPTWRWMGYDNSWVIIDGQMMQAVGGGGHWGGGMFINAMDMARFGYFTLRRGRWQDKQLLSDNWVNMALTPTPANTSYGFMNWFLNTGKKEMPSAPETAFFHLGNGTNIVYVDPDHDLVIVARWIKNNEKDGLVQRVLAAMK